MQRRQTLWWQVSGSTQGLSSPTGENPQLSHTRTRKAISAIQETAHCPLVTSGRCVTGGRCTEDLLIRTWEGSRRALRYQNACSRRQPGSRAFRRSRLKGPRRQRRGLSDHWASRDTSRFLDAPAVAFVPEKNATPLSQPRQPQMGNDLWVQLEPCLIHLTLRKLLWEKLL